MAKMYRVFIAGRGRHVFSASEAKDITQFIVDLKMGRNAEFPPHSDWSVDKKYDFGWSGLSASSHRRLQQAVAAQLPDDYDLFKVRWQH